MYDMYQWDRNAPATETGEMGPARASSHTAAGNGRAPRSPAGPAAAAQAVQEALDRRDNGGVTPRPA